MIVMGDRKKALTAILGPDSPNVGIKGDENYPDKPEGHDMLEAMANELMECIHSKDVSGLVHCLKAIFQELDREPNKEGPHI